MKKLLTELYHIMQAAKVSVTHGYFGVSQVTITTRTPAQAEDLRRALDSITQGKY